LYGELGRTGVYHFQDMYRILPLKADAAKARRMLHLLPETNWLKRNSMMMSGDISGSLGNAGITDMLLHECDRSFRVPGIVQLARSAGLRVIDFLVFDQYVPPEGLMDEITDIPAHWLELASFAELARGDIFKHFVFLGEEKTRTATGAPVTPDSVPCHSGVFRGLKVEFPQSIRKSVVTAVRENTTLTFTDFRGNTHQQVSALMVEIVPLVDCRRSVKEMELLLSEGVAFAAQDALASFYSNEGTQNGRVWFHLKKPCFRAAPALPETWIVESHKLEVLSQVISREIIEFNIADHQKYQKLGASHQLMVFINGTEKKTLRRIRNTLGKVKAALKARVLVMYVRCETLPDFGVMDRFLVMKPPAVRLAESGLQRIEAFRPHDASEPAIVAKDLVAFVQGHMRGDQGDFLSVRITVEEAQQFADNRKLIDSTVNASTGFIATGKQQTGAEL